MTDVREPFIPLQDVVTSDEIDSPQQLDADQRPLVTEEASHSTEPDLARCHLSLIRLFWLFITFGLRAWGGPLPQIAMLKQYFIFEVRWITEERFNRVLAVYQALPGPEATELCCYFGMLSRGRLGAVIAGLGFLLPGFFIMLLISYLYAAFGFTSAYVSALFLGIQPTAAAMVLKAVHRISEGALKRDGEFCAWLFAIAVYAAIQNVMHFNFFISLGLGGVLNALLHQALTAYQSADGRTRHCTKRVVVFFSLSATVLVLSVVGFVLFLALVGVPSEMTIGTGLVGSKTLWGLFLLGLLAGLLTFGGAYTAIPFVQADAVFAGQWLTNQQFLDGIAVAQIIPAPLVMFSTFVGFMGGGVLGALLMTVGMFLPAFSFTLIGHNFFEKVINMKTVTAFLDGVTAAVMGLIGVTAIQMARSSVTSVGAALIYGLSLTALYAFKAPATAAVLVIASGLAGLIFFGVPQ